MVRQRGHELADQVAVRAVDLQHVETGLPDAAGDLRVGVNDVFDVLDIQHHAFGMVAEARHIRNHGRGEPGNEARAPCALMAFASLESPLILLSSAALMPRMKAVPRGSTAVPSMLTKPTPPLARSA